jgi:BirA family biotin operon repressor/biotin-[acetyl-CoA-carboxylase] ligase
MPLEMLAAIDRPATSILAETGASASVEAVLEALLAALPPRLDAWQCHGFEGLRDAWDLHAYGLGLPVTVEEGDTQKTGVMVGLDELGALRMRHVDGQEERILLGDVLF